MSRLTIGVCKGRTFRAAESLLQTLGYDLLVNEVDDRCYQLYINKYQSTEIRVVLVSPRDVAQYLLQRVIDVAVCYDDVLHHLGEKNYHLKPVLAQLISPEPSTVPARLCLVGKPGVDLKSPHNRIVSEYVDAAARLSSFRALIDLGLQGTFLQSHGAAEALVVGDVADLAIVVVETGTTLATNKLEIYAEIAPLTLNTWINCENPRGLEFMRKHGTTDTVPTRVVIDGMDGAGKSTIVKMLRTDRELKQFFFLDRGFPSDFTLLPDEKLPAESPLGRVILLECDPDVAKTRLRGRDQTDKFETRSGLWYFRHKFRELSGRYGWPIVYTTESSPEETLAIIKIVLLLGPFIRRPVDAFTQEAFDALPLVARGESKVIRQLNPSFDLIQYIPSIYSHKKRRADFIPGSEVQRMEATRHALRLLAWEQVSHTYWYVGSKFILAERLAQPPPPIEVIVKSRYTGTDMYRYVGLESAPTRTGLSVVDPHGLYPEPYVRFDWRNANTHVEGDVAMSESLADRFIDVDETKCLVLRAYEGLNRHFHRFGVDIWDLCFFVTANGRAVFGEVSPDNGRYKRMDDSKDTDLDKDIWRAGGSSDLVLQKWTLLAGMIRDYSNRFFHDLYAVKLSEHIADWPLVHVGLCPWPDSVDFSDLLANLKEANWEWITDEPTLKTLAYRVWSIDSRDRMLLVKESEKLRVYLLGFEARCRTIAKTLLECL